MESCSPINTFAQLVSCLINNVANPLIKLLIAGALAYFLWGLVSYIRNANNEKVRADGRWMMISGIIALFVMVSVWGLVNLVVGIFGLDNNTLPSIPTLPGNPVSVSQPLVV